MIKFRVAEENKFVVKYQGHAFWFNSEEKADAFMRKIEDELLYN